jgi:hypothetical protein
VLDSRTPYHLMSVCAILVAPMESPQRELQREVFHHRVDRTAGAGHTSPHYASREDGMFPSAAGETVSRRSPGYAERVRVPAGIAVIDRARKARANDAIDPERRTKEATQSVPALRRGGKRGRDHPLNGNDCRVGRTETRAADKGRNRAAGESAERDRPLLVLCDSSLALGRGLGSQRWRSGRTCSPSGHRAGAAPGHTVAIAARVA